MKPVAATPVTASRCAPAAADKPADPAKALNRRDDHFYEELSRTNNELANLQRGLARKNAELEKEITRRQQAEAALEKAHRERLEMSRQAGMAEIATSVLHNVGNVLNSANVSANLISAQIGTMPVADLGRVVELLRDQGSNLGAFFTDDPRGPKVLEFLAQLAGSFIHLQKTQSREVASLEMNLEHIKEIVAMQQSLARAPGVAETLQVTDLVEDTLHMSSGSFQRHEVRIVREFAPKLPAIATEKHKVLQILVNLVSNAMSACDDSSCADKRVTVRVSQAGNRVQVQVIDNGVGIPPENLASIFNHGFTTKKDGHGFGLHSSANAAVELGGSLAVHSDGPGQGATFTLELPVTRGTGAKPIGST